MNWNVLYGKKLVTCGDSFTEGDFTGLPEEERTLIYDDERGMYKTYPWWIAERNNMILVNEAKCGTIMALSKEYLESPEKVDMHHLQPFSLERYKKVPTDADYILIQFGLNDIFWSNLGTIDDETNETFYGAFNIVLEYFITNIPYAKIGTIISNAYLSEPFRRAIKEVSVKWGIPYLDMMGDQSISTTLSKEGMCDKARAIRDKQFMVSETNGHPNLKAHELNSTIIEDFLRHI